MAVDEYDDRGNLHIATYTVSFAVIRDGHQVEITAFGTGGVVCTISTG